MFGKVETPALKRLEKQFQEAGGRWNEIEIGQIFRVKSNPQLNKEDLIFKENGEYPYFTRTCLNNGVNGYVEYLDEEHKIQGGCLAVGMLGMRFFYMEKDFYAGQFTKAICPRSFLFNHKLGLYFATLLNKHSQGFLGVLVRDFEEKFLKTKINVPLDIYGDIVFEYIERYIKEFEQQCKDQYEKYLLRIGDCQLTRNEVKMLGSIKSKKHRFKKIKIGELFKIQPTKSYKMTNIALFKTKGDIPVVTNSSLNNGVSGYVDMQPTEKGNIITYSDTTTSDGIFYQPKDFVGYSHVQGLYPIAYQKKMESLHTTLFCCGI